MAVFKNGAWDYRAELEQAQEALRADRLDEANNVSERILLLNPHEPRALFLIGCANLKAEKYGTAYHVFRRCLNYQIRDEAIHNIAHCLSEMRMFEEAEEWAERLGDTADAHNLIASFSSWRASPADTIKHAKRALELDPTKTDAKWNGSFAYLSARKWAEGWDWYDSAIGLENGVRPRNSYTSSETPLWKGEPGSVVVYGEQGLGDKIMFASCLPDAMAKAEIIVDIDLRLVPLFRRSFPEAFVTSKLNGKLILPKGKTIDYCLPIGGLPGLFRRKDEDFPGQPYLIADPERRIQWRALFDHIGPKPKIGVMWRGGIPKTGEPERSLELDDFMPLFMTDCDFISLSHRQDAKREIAGFEKRTGVKVHHWDRAVGNADYDDAVAMIAELDAVVAVQTTVVHVAGALGIPCHVLVSKVPEWRYGHDHTDMLWHKSVKLYRQTDKWPIEDIADQFKLREAA